MQHRETQLGIFFLFLIIVCFPLRIAAEDTSGTHRTPETLSETHPTGVSRPRVLLTGFKSFGEIKNNPSEWILAPLAESVKACANGKDITFASLEVKPGIFTEKESLFMNAQVVISLGVHAEEERGGKKKAVRVEKWAQNCFCDPDDRTAKTKKIDPKQDEDHEIEGPPLGSLPVLKDYRTVFGTPGSTGTYVCNATFYHLCQKKRGSGYFIHIPPISESETESLVADLTTLICEILKKHP